MIGSSEFPGLYHHGIQPSLPAAWLFNFPGRPSLTQQWVRHLQRRHRRNSR